MEEKKSLALSMEQTIEYGNLEFVGDIGEVMLDAVLNDGVLKDIPILGTIVGVGKCIRNIYDALFAKKLIAFLIPIKDTNPKDRAEAIKKWEEDENFRGIVGETLLGMIQRCDDSIKADWLSKLFYELVLRRKFSRLFMRAEKTLSSLSVMDMQSFLNLSKENYLRIKEEDCEPYLGSGLYLNPQVAQPINGELHLDNKYCQLSEVGLWIYHILNGIPIREEEHMA